MNQLQIAEKDLPLRDDIRLLGRILGDTVRDQAGRGGLRDVERIRQTSIRFHRDEDQGARRELEARAQQPVRAGERSTSSAPSATSPTSPTSPRTSITCAAARAHARARSAPRAGSIAYALARAQAAGPRAVRAARLLRPAVICPVLTAHPTEVRRKSSIDREMELARLLAERDRVRLTPEEEAAGEEALRRVRADPVADQHPAPHAAERRRRGANGTRPITTTRSCASCRGSTRRSRTSSRPWTRPGSRSELPSFLRMGSWIGGDRDGNPFVTAEVLRQALRMQSRRVLRFYLEEVHLLGAELSLDGRLVERLGRAAGAGRTLARSAPHRRDEPYRRAMSGIYARLAATACARSATPRPRDRAVGEAPPYADAAELVGRPRRRPPLADRDTARRRSRAAGCATCAAPSTCSASISPASTCARTPTCTSARSPSCSRRRGPGTGYAGAGRGRRVAPCCSRSSRRRGRSPRRIVALLRRDRLGAGDRARGRRGAPALRAGRGAQLRHLQGGRRLRHPRGRAAAQGGRAAAPARRARSTSTSCRCSRPSPICATAAASWTRCSPLPAVRAPAREPRPRAGGDARLLRQQQGRRLPDLGLGALQGRDRADRGLPAARRRACACSTAAAARSAAAAGRATRPSWPSPAAPCRARSASPSRAR